MQNLSLRYGDGSVDLALSGAKSVVTLREQPTQEIQNVAAAFRESITSGAVGSPPLNALIGAQDLVTIVISDITRFWMRQDIITKLLVEYLRDEIGLPCENMAILVALGTHRSQTQAELEKLVTLEVLRSVRVVNHDCLSPDLVSLGVTSRGTEVRINPLAVGRKLILIGGTVHHLMAGFGGGRKSILPGICADTTIRQNHLHALSPNEPCSNPEIGLGQIEGNPLNDDMMEAAALASPTFSINVVANSQGRHVRLISGHWREAWLESCRVVNALFGVPIAYKADIVVASCGGYPKDISLYQATKSLLNASQAVKPGGTIAFFAECREGGGAREFFGWIEPLRRGALDADLRRDFTIAGYIFYAACEVIANHRVIMLTQIDQRTMRDMGIAAFASPEALSRELDASGRDVYVMPHAGSIVPWLRN